MATFGLIIWWIIVLICVAVVVKKPNFIKNPALKKRYPGYFDALTANERNFIERHVQAFLDYRYSEKIRNTFAFSALVFSLIFFALLGAVFCLAVLAGVPLIDSVVLGKILPASGAYLDIPFGGVESLISMFLVVPTAVYIQRYIAQRSPKNSVSMLFSPSPFEEKLSDHDFKTKMRQSLKENLRMGRLNAGEKYTVKNLAQILINAETPFLKRFILASVILTLSLFVMGAFSFASLSDKTLTYSPKFSFRVHSVSTDTISDVNFSCRERDNKTYYKASLLLDDGAVIKVYNYTVKGVPEILMAQGYKMADVERAKIQCEGE